MAIIHQAKDKERKKLKSFQDQRKKAFDKTLFKIRPVSVFIFQNTAKGALV